VDSLDLNAYAAGRPLGAPGSGARGPGEDEPGGRDAAFSVTALYQAHAVGMIRLAVIMLGDRAAAEDVVQEAFLSLYRSWDRLSDTGKAVTYVRSSVLNGCRNALRARARRERRDRATAWSGVPLESVEATVLIGEDHRRMLAAIRALPDRQREALVLRFYLDMSEDETARAMRISRGTVKSATHRAIAALGRMLEEGS